MHQPLSTAVTKSPVRLIAAATAITALLLTLLAFGLSLIAPASEEASLPEDILLYTYSQPDNYLGYKRLDIILSPDGAATALIETADTTLSFSGRWHTADHCITELEFDGGSALWVWGSDYVGFEASRAAIRGGRLYPDVAHARLRHPRSVAVGGPRKR